MRVAPNDRKKKHHSKSRDGCLTCKKRHLKCDEYRPECRRCVQDFGKCEGYKIPKAWLFEPSPHENAVFDCNDATSVISGSGHHSSAAASGSSRGSHSSCTSPPSSVDSSEQARQKRWAPKSRTGCSGCKKRRVKCDEARPKCTRCRKLDVECEYAAVSQNEETTISLLGNNEQDHNEHVGFGSNQTPDLLALALESTPYKSHSEHQALQFWLTRAENCQVISRSFGSFNILGVELPKAAWEYQSVRHGLLAAAAVTNSLQKFANGEADIKDAAVQALKYGSLAIQHLFEEKPSPYVTVLVAFVFWFMEAWYGSWARALMHLASATRISREGHARGEVSQAVAWYVQVVSEGVPAALKEAKLLSLVGAAKQETQNSLPRLRYGIREVELGSAWISQVESKARRLRPSDCGLLLIPLQIHQEQMKWLCDRWRKYLRARNIKSTVPIPDMAMTSTYAKVKEQTDLFLARSANFDLLVLEVRLKMILRSLPLYVAGPNIEMRRDAAMVIPYGYQVQARINQNYLMGTSTPKVESTLPMDSATVRCPKGDLPSTQQVYPIRVDC